MAFSYVERSGDGVTKSFTFNFTGQDEGYISKEDIVVEVDGVSTDFKLTGPNSLEVKPAPVAGSNNVLIRRVMPKDKTYADFRTGNNFGQEVLNNSFLQSLYIIQEVLDGWFPKGFVFQTPVEFGYDIELNGHDINGANQVNTQNLKIDGVAVEELLETIGSASFSPISWHEQEINEPISIPANKNAWSFGPSLEINSQVTVGEGSYWTIAEQGATDSGGGDEGGGDLPSIDFGEI